MHYASLYIITFYITASPRLHYFVGPSHSNLAYLHFRLHCAMRLDPSTHQTVIQYLLLAVVCTEHLSNSSLREYRSFPTVYTFDMLLHCLHCCCPSFPILPSQQTALLQSHLAMQRLDTQQTICSLSQTLSGHLHGVY